MWELGSLGVWSLKFGVWVVGATPILPFTHTPTPPETTPDTTAYLVAGYAVIFGLMALWIASLAIRRRNLERDLEVMEELEEREVRELGR